METSTVNMFIQFEFILVCVCVCVFICVYVCMWERLI